MQDSVQESKQVERGDIWLESVVLDEQPQQDPELSVYQHNALRPLVMGRAVLR